MTEFKKEFGSLDEGYDARARVVRQMAKKVGFDGTIPVVPHPDSEGMFVVILLYRQDAEDQARPKVKKLEQMLQEHPKFRHVITEWLPPRKSKKNAVVAVRFEALAT